jgi:predicted nucleic acid-binding protein
VLRDKFKWPEDMLYEMRARLARFTSVVTPMLKLDVVESDPDDNRVIECTVEASSRFVVTGDTDLLRLGQFQGIPILRVPEFMEMMQWPAV